MSSRSHAAGTLFNELPRDRHEARYGAVLGLSKDLDALERSSPPAVRHAELIQLDLGNNKRREFDRQGCVAKVL